MRFRSGAFPIALFTLAATVAIAIADAILIQHHMPHDRIALLVAYCVAPMLAVAFAAPFLRWRTTLILITAAAIPPLTRYAIGERTADAAFNRLSLNPLWFVLIWFPTACAVLIVLGPRTADSLRATAFGRRLWRFGAAALLMFIATTFTTKSSLSTEGSILEGGVAAEFLLVGTFLLAADLIPARAQKVALQWSWLVLSAISVGIVVAAAMHVDDLREARERLRSDLRRAESSRREMASIVTRYEAENRLTPADRAKIATYFADYATRARTSREALAGSASPVLATAEILLPAVAMFALYAILLMHSWRARIAERNPNRAGASIAAVPPIARASSAD